MEKAAFFYKSSFEYRLRRQALKNLPTKAGTQNAIIGVSHGRSNSKCSKIAA
jgi:hypothetical protein